MPFGIGKVLSTRENNNDFTKECATMKKDKKNSENLTHYMPIGMCLGISIGVAIGVATDYLAIYMPLGMSIGMCVGALIDAQNRKKSKGDSEDSEDKE